MCKTFFNEPLATIHPLVLSWITRERVESVCKCVRVSIHGCGRGLRHFREEELNSPNGIGVFTKAKSGIHNGALLKTFFTVYHKNCQAFQGIASGNGFIPSDKTHLLFVHIVENKRRGPRTWRTTHVICLKVLSRNLCTQVKKRCERHGWLERWWVIPFLFPVVWLTWWHSPMVCWKDLFGRTIEDWWVWLWAWKRSKNWIILLCITNHVFIPLHWDRKKSPLWFLFAK